MPSGWFISFGAPVPGVTLAVENWLAIRLASESAQICGLTIIGFKRFFSNLRSDLIESLPARVGKLKAALFLARYSDESDTLTFRFGKEQPAYYERFDENIYLEKSLVGGGIVG